MSKNLRVMFFVIFCMVCMSVSNASAVDVVSAKQWRPTVEWPEARKVLDKAIKEGRRATIGGDWCEGPGSENACHRYWAASVDTFDEKCQVMEMCILGKDPQYTYYPVMLTLQDLFGLYIREEYKRMYNEGAPRTYGRKIPSSVIPERFGNTAWLLTNLCEQIENRQKFELKEAQRGEECWQDFLQSRQLSQDDMPGQQLKELQEEFANSFQEPAQPWPGLDVDRMLTCHEYRMKIVNVEIMENRYRGVKVGFLELQYLLKEMIDRDLGCLIPYDLRPVSSKLINCN